MEKLTIATILSCLIFLFSCSNQEKKWEEVKKVNTIAAYNEFVHKFPKSPHVQEAKWIEIKKINTITTYNEFIHKFPNSPYLQGAKENISNCIEQMIFDRFFNEVSQQKSNKDSGWTYYGNMDISSQSKWEKLGIRSPKPESLSIDYPVLWNGALLDTIVFQKISWDLKMGSNGYGVPVPGKTYCLVKFTDSSLEIQSNYTSSSKFELVSMSISENSTVQLKSGEKYRYINGLFEK